MGAAVDKLQMTVPPAHSALVGAELPGPVFPFGDFASAVQAGTNLRKIRIAQFVSPAEGLYRIDGDAKCISNFRIAALVMAHFRNSLLLQSCHVNSSRASCKEAAVFTTFGKKRRRLNETQ